MPFQSRATWTTRPNRAVATKRRQRHLTWHYPGFGTDSIKTASWAHSRCLAQINTWEKQHQARGSKSIEYNLFACAHGYLIEGRGNRQNGANGTSAANRAGMSCQVLIGDNEPLTAGHRSAMREAVAWAEGKHPGMTSTQYGHRHWVGTRCPGPYVMAEIPVRAGLSAPGPGASVPAASKPKGDPGKPWTTSPRVAAMSMAAVKAVQAELVGAGYDLGKYGVDGVYGDSTGTAVKALQTDLGLTSDGVYGPGTEQELMTIKTELAALSKKIDAIPREVMHIQVPLEGDGWKGKSGNLTGIRKWYAHDIGRIVRLLGEIKTLIANKRVIDADVARIADAVAKKIPR